MLHYYMAIQLLYILHEIEPTFSMILPYKLMIADLLDINTPFRERG